MTNLAVQFRGVEKRYPHFKLDHIDFELPRGQIMGFIGPNGAGKTTTIRILMGLIHQDSGEATVLGHTMPGDQIAAKREIGFVSEDMRLYRQATLAWHIDFIRAIYPQWDHVYAEDLMRRFDLNPKQKLKGFSHGQRLKASLLLALARRPRLLVLDEPTAGLDPAARREALGGLMEAMRDEEVSILFSSHQTQDVEQMSDRIVFIDRGRIIDAQDKETYLDRWRRIHLEAGPEVALPDLPGVVEIRRSGRLAVVTAAQYEPAMANAFQQAGAVVQEVENMTLEEIFLANVARNREDKAA